MGRVSRYKRAKNTFDVQQLHERKSDGCDDPVNAATTARQKDSKTKRRDLVVKYGPDGKPLNGAHEPKVNNDDSDDERNDSASRKRKRDKDSRDGGLEGIRPGESLKDFRTRINRETQERLYRDFKKNSNRTKRQKERAKNKKDRERERKLRRQVGEDFMDMTDKEREVYRREPSTYSINDRAEAPPEFTAQHSLKQRQSDPNDRSRFAKLSFAGAASGAKGPGKDAGKPERTAYEKMQMEAMRERVLARYNDLRNKRRAQNSFESA
mmetsp:Transcript_2115/g.4834  ORF Transcript_2115/g.4834 Transcript_2115/m.4834 type:complete len:267 (+) Transcript_2115:880-1680(+)